MATELDNLIAQRDQLILDIEAAKKQLLEVSKRIENICMHSEICKEEHHDFDRTRYFYHCVRCLKLVNYDPYMKIVKENYYG